MTRHLHRRLTPGTRKPRKPSSRRRSLRTDDRTSPREVTRHVRTAVQCMLWGQAGGRCEFSGHNKLLRQSSGTQKAHIYAFSEGGPRSSEIGHNEINDPSHLILVCHECHQKIDATRSGGRYTAPLLRQWKREHEERIERVTGVAQVKTSHILLYGANTTLLDSQSAAVAMFPDRHPAEPPIELSTINSSLLDRDEAFWSVESHSLRRKFQQSVGERLATREIQHLSVFALAPQPLLVLLGTLLGDSVPVDVYQPPAWNWPADGVPPWFEVHEPENRSGPAALVLALSATVTPDRIHSVLGPDASVWTVTVREPHNDMMQSREQLSELRTILRTLLDRIRAAQGQSSPLHIFPAAPVSAAVELGRVRMPSTDMPWHLYDQVNALGGFTAALTIGD